jgi:hypothetical protein
VLFFRAEKEDMLFTGRQKSSKIKTPVGNGIIQNNGIME